MDNLYKLYVSLGEPEGTIFHPEKLEEWAYHYIIMLQDENKKFRESGLAQMVQENQRLGLYD